LKGHGFSLAEPHSKKTWPLGPEAKTETLVEFINEYLIHHTRACFKNIPHRSSVEARAFRACPERGRRAREECGSQKAPLGLARCAPIFETRFSHSANTLVPDPRFALSGIAFCDKGT